MKPLLALLLTSPPFIIAVVAFIILVGLKLAIASPAFADEAKTGARPYQPYGAGAPQGWYKRHPEAKSPQYGVPLTQAEAEAMRIPEERGMSQRRDAELKAGRKLCGPYEYEVCDSLNGRGCVVVQTGLMPCRTGGFAPWGS